MAINITKKNFQTIKALLEDEYIAKNLFSSKKLLEEFIGCNCVYISGKPALIYLNDAEALLGIIKANGYNVNCIEDLDYFIEEENEPKSRDEIADNYSHTKRVESKSFNGLMISVFDKLEVNYNDKKQYFYALEGSGLFLHYTSKLQLDDDVIVVGVENPQVVWYINNYKHLFENDKKYLFLCISEYKTTYQYKWLESFSGEYIHFGDFDLAGINIYLNTIVPKLKKAKSHSFLIPDNIYEIIKKKNYMLDYSNQTKYLNITSKEDKNLQKLIEFIKSHKITIEQEDLSKYKGV